MAETECILTRKNGLSTFGDRLAALLHFIGVVWTAGTTP